MSADLAKGDAAFIGDLVELVQKHYPDGRMRVDSIVISFGMVLSAAVAGQPEDVRDRAARFIAQQIRVPDKPVRRLFR